MEWMPDAQWMNPFYNQKQIKMKNNQINKYKDQLINAREISNSCMQTHQESDRPIDAWWVEKREFLYQ